MNLLSNPKRFYWICDRCSTHAPIPFNTCPDCGSHSIRKEGLWEGYFANEFAPQHTWLRFFLEHFRCPICGKKRFHRTDVKIFCLDCDFEILITSFLESISKGKIKIYDPSYRNKWKVIFRGHERNEKNL